MTRKQRNNETRRAGSFGADLENARHVRGTIGAMIVALSALFGVLCTTPALAQSGDGNEMTGSAVVAGGQVAGEEYEMDATVGQAEVGSLTGGDYQLTAGFWAAFCVPVPYGDISQPWDVVDVDDIVRMLDGFVYPELYPEADIDPCTPDGDVDDISAMLEAFIGYPGCPPQCR